MIKSHALIFSDFNTTWYKKWAKLLKQDNKHLEGYALRANKFWQNAVMAQALYERGALEPGKMGLGFGVGRERLPALFASMGVDVMATDQDFTTKKAKHWSQHELAEDTNSLNQLSIASPKDFQERVSYQAADMMNIPKSFSDKYDFVWSNCALGHLGSIGEGLRFIAESTKCLKPGGFAVHTTEVNVLSNGKTVDSGDTVIFRPKDFLKLSKMLYRSGCELDPVVLSFGNSKDDHRITMHPEFGNDFSKINFKENLITQVVLIIKKPLSKKDLRANKSGHLKTYLNNVKVQKNFRTITPYRDDLRSLKSSRLDAGSVEALNNSLNVSVSIRPKDVYLAYKNLSKYDLYSVHHKSERLLPLSVATSSPTDRESIFKAKNWYNDQANRPSSGLFSKDKSGKWKSVNYVKPGSEFAFKVTLDPTNVKKGSYSESFALVQEGNRHMPETEVTINISVTK